MSIATVSTVKYDCNAKLASVQVNVNPDCAMFHNERSIRKKAVSIGHVPKRIFRLTESRKMVELAIQVRRMKMN